MKDLVGPNRFYWILPLGAAVTAIAVSLPVIVFVSVLDALLLGIFIVAPLALIFGILCLIWLVIGCLQKKPKPALSAALALAVFLSLFGFLTSNQYAIRPWLRWTFWSERYKAEVLRQPDSVTADLKHIEWDSWAFGDSNFEYLVYDPSDSLKNAVKNNASGRLLGIPCEVPEVHRLERHWYFVRFYTNQAWGECPSSNNAP